MTQIFSNQTNRILQYQSKLVICICYSIKSTWINQLIFKHFFFGFEMLHQLVIISINNNVHKKTPEMPIKWIQWFNKKKRALKNSCHAWCSLSIIIAIFMYYFLRHFVHDYWLFLSQKDYKHNDNLLPYVCMHAYSLTLVSQIWHNKVLSNIFKMLILLR